MHCLFFATPAAGATRPKAFSAKSTRQDNGAATNTGHRPQQKEGGDKPYEHKRGKHSNTSSQTYWFITCVQHHHRPLSVVLLNFFLPS